MASSLGYARALEKIEGPQASESVFDMLVDQSTHPVVLYHAAACYLKLSKSQKAAKCIREGKQLCQRSVEFKELAKLFNQLI
ncbi:hypothetical protein HOH87_04220 [bacterium]|jgi:hypothetical protein|nr:hypothetical protein [bacterium]